MSVENSGFQEEIEKWAKFPEVFEEELAKEAKGIAKFWVGYLRENTPVGETRQLRPGWNVKIERGMSGIQIVVFNNVHYAKHWNYGHRVKVWGRYTGHVVPGTYLAETSRRLAFQMTPKAIRNAMKNTESRLSK